MKNNLNKLFYSLARASVRDIEEYNAGIMPQDCIRISANENNIGVSPKAYNAMRDAIRDGNRYPDPDCARLKQKIAESNGLAPEQILIGNGLDGIFTMLGRAFLETGDEVICGELTFSVYADTALIMGAVPVTIPMTEEMELDVHGFIDAVTEKTKMIFFCNPNNPTGTVAGTEEIKYMLDRVPREVIFVLDEAYMDFAENRGVCGIDLLENYPNLIVCRTFSKIYGLAGLRVGWIAAHPELLKYINKVREPYNVSTIAAAGAEAAIGDKVFLEESRTMVLEERAKLSAHLKENGISFIPSHGNFILLTQLKDPLAAMGSLRTDGLIARLLTFRDTKMIRVSIGLPHENRILENSLIKIIQGE